MQRGYPPSRVSLFALLCLAATVARADGPGLYTIFDGPGAGSVLDSLDGVLVTMPGQGTFGSLITGPHCAASALTVGDVTLGPTERHYHGFLRGVDDGGEGCGHGRAAPGDYAGLFAQSFTNGTVRSFVLPHVLEVSGSTANTPNTFDTTLFATYAGGMTAAPPGAATVDLFLFDDQTGTPLQGASGTICGDCGFVVGSGDLPRDRTVGIEDLIDSQGGGFGAYPLRLGYGIVVVGGSADDIALQGFVVNSHSSPFDLSVFGFAPVELAAAANRFGGAAPNGLMSMSVSAIGTQLRLDGLEDAPGMTDAAANAIDTLIKGIYVGGQVDGTAAGEIDLSLTLFNADGSGLRGANGELLPPQLFHLDGADRVFAATVEELLAPLGGLAGPFAGYAIADVTGDLDNFLLAAILIETGADPAQFARFQVSSASLVPLPPSALALGSGLLCIALGRRRLRRATRREI